VAGTGDPYLKLRAITKDFSGVRAVDSVSLAIDAGEFVCFLGPSGCGKTTLLRIIAGLEHQTTGTIEQAGRDISNLPPAARDFGIVFQSYALFPNLTVFENVAYGLHGRGMDRAAIRARVEELLALVDLPELSGRYPAQLSGGQQQRVAVARALAPSPTLLLLDEPLSALDARVRVHLRHELKEIHRRLGLTTIMVTHDQEEALTMADRVVVMSRGIIEQVGTPEEIYRLPASLFVADFVGSMNRIEGTVRGGALAVDGLHLTLPAAASEGTAVTALMRPEDILVGERGEANCLTMRIDSLEFLGPVQRAYLVPEAGAGGLTLVAEVSGHRIRRHSLAEGQSVPVTLPPERLRVLPRR
jgi:iron(III) transport system ATP-binding protein